MPNMDDKYAFLTTAMHVFDENERLRMENEQLKRIIKGASAKARVPQSGDDGTAVDFARAHIYETGRAAIAQEALNYWHSVRTHEENGDKVAESYDDWVEHGVEVSKIPGWISRDAFMDMFGDLFHDIYDTERLKALAPDED